MSEKRMKQFLFQIGAIKSVKSEYPHAKPAGFYSKLVRLKGNRYPIPANDNHVSIPNWCD